MKNFSTLLLSMVLGLSAVIAEAQSVGKAGTTSAQFLRIPVGARSAALGGAVTAGVNDGSALYWNPAAIADLGQTTVFFEHGDWFADLGHSYLGFIVPTGEKSAFGLSITALTMGAMDETTMEFPDGTGRTFSANSISIGASYSTYLFDSFAMGFTSKYIRETIWNTSAGTLAFDFGTMFKTPFDGMRFAASITNAGGRMQMFGDELLISAIPGGSGDTQGEYAPDAYLYTAQYDLPLQLKFGVAYDAIKSDMLRASIFVDGQNPSDNKQSISIASEVGLLNDTIQLRAGLPELFLEDRMMTFTAGMAVRTALSETLALDFGYAYQNHTHLGGVNRLSLQVKF